MKNLNKWLSILMALVVLMGMTAGAAAEETGNYSITIKNTVQGHIYEAYQIFSGDYSKDENGAETLANIQWGSSVNEEYAGQNDAAAKAKELSEIKDAAAKKAAANAFAAEIEKYLTAPKGSSNKVSGEGYTISNLPAGYYLVKDQNGSLNGDNDSYTLFMLQIVGDVSVEPKAEMPSFMKKVDDKNDSDSSEDSVQWQDSSDYDIGDKVPFLLMGKVAANYDAYTTYKFVFHDDAEEGLTFDASSVKAYVGTFNQAEGKDYFETSGEKEIDRQYFEVTSSNDNDFTVTFDNLKNIGDVKAGDTILVKYEATLNEKANIGARGNKNTAYLQFSNNPNKEHEDELGKTPVDTVIVFTYKTVINKVDGENNPLNGADFKLEKLAGSDWVKVEKAAAAAEPAVEGEEPVAEETTFTFIGIDAGRYRLSETKTPVGYNSIEDIYFTVTATHDILADDPKLLTLAADETGENGSDLATGEATRFAASHDLESGSLTSDIVNLSGAVLPSTGGIGTTIFYAAGGVLVLAAVVLLITKRRMSNDD